MTYTVGVCDISPQTLASVHGRANATNIGDRIRELLSEVWDFIRSSGLEHLGHNVVVYPGGEASAAFHTDEGMRIETGVQVKKPFESTERVICSASPGGRVATTIHLGPYEKLSEAHAAVCQWCKENGHVLAGPNWELYGHWTDNPDELRTDVFYLLSG